MTYRLSEMEQRIAEFPAWARPPFYGMFLVYAMIAAKAVIALPILAIVLFASGPEGLLRAIWILIVAGLAGFAGGIVYSLVQPLLRRTGRLQPFATGWLCVFAYLAVLAWLLSPDDPHSSQHFDPHSAGEWLLMAALSLVFGSIVGAAFVDHESGKRPRKTWVQRKQRVTGRVHPRNAKR